MNLDEFLLPGAEDALLEAVAMDGYSTFVMFQDTNPRRLLVRWEKDDEIGCVLASRFDPELHAIFHEAHLVTAGHESQGFFEVLWRMWYWQQAYGVGSTRFESVEGAQADRYLSSGLRWEPDGTTDKRGARRGEFVLDSEAQVEEFLNRS